MNLHSPTGMHSWTGKDAVIPASNYTSADFAQREADG